MKESKIINPITNRYMEDLTGKKFGKLIVKGLDIIKMKEIYEKGRKGSYWLCKCECGNEKTQSIYGGNLKNNKVISCGCSRKAINRETNFKDLTGLKFGRLEVLSLNEEKTMENRLNGYRIRFWNCVCECGNSVVISGESLKNHKTKSCGCLKEERIEEGFKNKAINGNSVGHYIEQKYGEMYFHDIWDKDKNKDLNPYEINRGSNRTIYIKCQKNKTHPSYKVSALHFCISESRCPQCESYSKGEERINDCLQNNGFIDVTYEKNKLKLYKNEKIYIRQQEFDGLLGLKNGNLSYDFYFPKYNFLIEYQGEYHDGTVSNQTKEDFKKQVEHDNRKRNFAKEHNIKLLEIWYWDFDNIESILNKELKLNNITNTENIEDVS